MENDFCGFILQSLGQRKRHQFCCVALGKIVESQSLGFIICKMGTVSSASLGGCEY